MIRKTERSRNSLDLKFGADLLFIIPFVLDGGGGRLNPAPPPVVVVVLVLVLALPAVDDDSANGSGTDDPVGGNDVLGVEYTAESGSAGRPGESEVVEGMDMGGTRCVETAGFGVGGWADTEKEGIIGNGDGVGPVRASRSG